MASASGTESTPLVIEGTLFTDGGSMIIHFFRNAEVYSSPAQHVALATNAILVIKALHQTGAQPDLSMPDPGLSPRGDQQCYRFAWSITRPELLSGIFCSPMVRTMDTACFALEPFINYGIFLHAYPHLQDLDSGPNGTGQDPAILARMYSYLGSQIDLQAVHLGWNLRDHGRWSSANVESRLQEFFQAVKEGYNSDFRPHVIEIAIVTHDAILKKLFSHSTPRDSQELDVTSCEFDGIHLTELSTQQVNLWRRRHGLPALPNDPLF